MKYFKIIPIIVLALFVVAPTTFATLSGGPITSQNNQSNTFFQTVFSNTKELGENIFTKTSQIIKEIYSFREKSKDSFKRGVFDGFGLTKEMLGNTTNSIFSLLDQRVGPTYFNVKEKSNTTGLQKINSIPQAEYLSREEISNMITIQINQAGLTGGIKNNTVENVGPKGPQGLTGEAGPVGPRGPKGDKGEDGASINSSNFVTWTSFENQIDRIYDSINEDIDSDDEDSSGSSSGHDEVTIGTANGLSLSDQVLSLGLSGVATSGSLSSSDWNIFNNKQSALVSGTNIKTINGSSILGSGNIEISGGSGGSMVYPETGIPVSTGSAWGTSITDNSSNWNAAYGWGDHADAGYLTGYTETDPTFSSWNKSTGISITKSQVSDFGTYSTDIHANIAALNSVSGANTGDQDLSGYSLTSHNHSGIYAPVLGADDNYVTDAEKVIIGNTSGTNTGDQNLSGYMLSSSFTDTSVTGKLLTGYVSGSGVISSTDTILQAIQKLNGNMVASGSGTVSSVSVATANGISGTVSNPTTTPEITLLLGDITPSSVGIDNLNLNGNTISSTSGGINLTPLSGQKLTIIGNTDVTGDLVPTANNTYNLGSATNYWHSMYVGPGSIYVDGQKVLQTDISDSVVVSSDDAQNLILKTSEGGNIELNPATGLTQGQILLKGNVVLTGTKTFETSDNSAVIFADGISSPSFTTSVLNGGISITPNGTGNTYVTTGKFGIGNTSPSQALDVTGNILASGTILGSNLSGTNTGDETISSIKTKLGITTLSGSNTGDQDLSGYSLTSHNHSGIYAPVLGADDNYVTDAEKVIIGNTSGTNTGDETTSSIKTKLGITTLSGSNTGDNAVNTLYSGLASSKQDSLTSGTNIKTVGGLSLLGSGDLGTIGDSYLPNALTGKTYNGVSLSTSAGSGSYLSGDGSYDSLTSSQWTTTGSNIYYNTGRVFIGASSEATSSAKLYLEGSTSSADGPSSAIAGILGGYTFNPTEGGIQVGNRFVITNSPTLVANTSVAEMIRTVDNTTLENLVRGIDVTSNAGSNTAGINTGIRGSGATFGVQGVTSALAGGTSVPAALYGESTGTTQGDVLRLYSKTMTSASSFATFYHDTSAFTGTGLLMDFATGSGSFTGNFVDFQKNNTPLFRVTNGGVVVMGLSSTAATSAICSSLANGTSPTADTAYEIRDCSSIPVADYAEMYPLEKGAEYGDIMIVGDEMVNTYDTGSDGAIDWNKIKGTITKLVKSNKPYQSRVIGIVSDNHSDFSSVGYNIKDGDNPKPIAMNGRVPVKISPSSEDIKAGDYLTTSGDEGMAMKATRSGFVIGKALEAWSADDSKEMIMFFVEQGFYDSELEGDGSEEISADGLVYENANKEFVESIKFMGGVEFNIPPLFNNDTAGFAVIKAGSDRVDVIFDNPYISSPVVNVTISFEEGDLSEDEINEFFAGEIQSIITNKTQSQFTIRINKKITKDIRFSWVALAVRDPKVFESVIEGLQIDQDGIEKEGGDVENIEDEQNISSGGASGDPVLGSDVDTPSSPSGDVSGESAGENNSQDENTESGNVADDVSGEKVNTEIDQAKPATSTDTESEKVSTEEKSNTGGENSGESTSSEGETSSEAPAESSGGGDNESSSSEQSSQ